MLPFSRSVTIRLIVAILGTVIYQSPFEGMTNKKKIVEVKKTTVPDLVGTDSIEGLVSKQQELAGSLGPMMKQAQKMMDSLPKGFLEKAMDQMANGGNDRKPPMHI